jgi:ATP-binding cassette subfamily B protein
VSQGGINLSGGQKQRLAIARALARQADIYIFDDSFSALDFATDAKLRAALRLETTRATVFIVSQRIGTVMNADRIIVLDNGRVVGLGTHTELIRSCAVYREIAESQASIEEVA